MSASKKLIQASAGNVAGGDFYSYTIDNSVRSDPADLAELSRTFGTATSRKTFTISFWAKKSSAGQTLTNVMAKEVSAASEEYVGFYLDSIRFYNGATGNPGIVSVEKARDLSAWYHYLIAVDTTQATASDRIRIYKNGTEVAYGTNSNPSLNQDLTINSSGLHKITNFASTTYSDSTYRWNGYLAEFVFIDGTAYAPTDLGEDKNGVWIPKDPSGLTYGNNGFWLKFDNAGSLGTDSSGNGNNWTVTNYTSSDQMIDTPTNNFATLNPLINPTGLDSTFYEGNLAMQTNTAANSNGTNTTQSSIAIPSSGKWFFEFRPRSYGGQFNVFNAIGGIAPSYQTINDAGWKYGIEYYANGNTYINNVSTSYGASWVVGDVIGVLVDVDNVSVTFYKNGASQGEITSATHGFSNFDGWHFTLEDGSSTEYVYYDANFGQNGTFNNAITAGGNTDANGLGDFKYTVPTDALALCTANLPEPTIGPNSDTLSDENFDTLLWAGDGSSSKNVTGLDFTPDFTWIKNRSYGTSHILSDVVRGDNKFLASNGTGAEETDSTKFRTFVTGGIQVGSHRGVNYSGENYVAWNWKANGSGVSNTDGATASTVSVNTDAGFSIVTYTGTGSVTTVGHGLGVTPNFIIVKARDEGTGYNWCSYSSMLGPTYNTGGLDVTSAADAHPNYWSNTAPTSSVFTVSTYGVVNDNGGQMLAYCFAEVEGFSSFGSYTGNGSTDGPFIYTGFRPAFVIVKQTNVARGWYIFDSARDTYNAVDDYLRADDSAAEANFDSYDFLSNGFKLRNNNASFNESGGTYIYMAFAENPFKYSNAR